jgi:6-phosphofructokinase 1
MIGMNENDVVRVPLMEAVKMVGSEFEHPRHADHINDQTQDAAAAIAAKDFDKAMSLRDPEFLEMLNGFYATSRLDEVGRAPEENVSVLISICK